MNVLNDAVLPELIAAQRAPCLSLYQPTHRTHPENAQRLCDQLAKELAECSVIEKTAKQEGRNMIMILAPKSQ